MDLKLICVTVFLLGYKNAIGTTTMCKYLDCSDSAQCKEKYEHNVLECTTGEHIQINGVHQFATYSGVCNKCDSCCDGTGAKANDTQRVTIAAMCNGNQACTVTSANGYWMLLIFYECVAMTSPKTTPTMLPSTGHTTQGKAIATSKIVASTTTKMSTLTIKTEKSKSYTRASSATESATDVSTPAVANVAPSIKTGMVVLEIALIGGVCLYM